MKSAYLIDKDTLAFLRDLYRQERVEHPECELGFGWGGDSSGWVGVSLGLYHDRSQRMPPIYLYEDVSIHFLFPDSIPGALKSGVICFRESRFAILPADEFDPEDLVEGFLEPDEQ